MFLESEYYLFDARISLMESHLSEVIFWGDENTGSTKMIVRNRQKLTADYHSKRKNNIVHCYIVKLPQKAANVVHKVIWFDYCLYHIEETTNYIYGEVELAVFIV